MDFATFYKSDYLTISSPTLVHLSVGFPQPAPLKCFVFGAKLSIFSKTERCLTLKIGYTWVMYGSVWGALVVVHVHYDWCVGVSFVKFLRARDKNFEGSECSLRALGRSEAKASRGKRAVREVKRRLSLQGKT